MPMSRNGEVGSRVAARIISSGVTPLAHIAAISAPADVLDVDVQLMDAPVDEHQVQRGSAPISYSAPVMPPPPSTSATRLSASVIAV